MEFKDVLKLNKVDSEYVENYTINFINNIYNSNIKDYEECRNCVCDICIDFIENTDGTIIEVYESIVECIKDDKIHKFSYYHIYYYNDRNNYSYANYDRFDIYM
jgi:hypothetical protein